MDAERFDCWESPKRRARREATTGSEPTPEELARVMGLLPEQVDDALALMSESERRGLLARIKQTRAHNALGHFKEGDSE